MRTIYKYSVPVDDQIHEIEIPIESEITLVQCQNAIDIVNFWAEVYTDRELETQRYRVVGTGHEIHPNERVIGSTMPTPSLVWHLVKVYK